MHLQMSNTYLIALQYTFTQTLTCLHTRMAVQAMAIPAAGGWCLGWAVAGGGGGKPAGLLAGLRQNCGQQAGSWPGSRGAVWPRMPHRARTAGIARGWCRGTGQGSSGSFPGVSGGMHDLALPLAWGEWSPPLPRCPLAAGSPPACAERGPR